LGDLVREGLNDHAIEIDLAAPALRTVLNLEKKNIGGTTGVRRNPILLNGAQLSFLHFVGHVEENYRSVVVNKEKRVLSVLDHELIIGKLQRRARELLTQILELELFGDVGGLDSEKFWR